MDDLTQIIIIASSVVLVDVLQRKKEKRKCRVNPYLLKRNLKGRFSSDFEDMINNKWIFQENFHMSVEQFNNLFKIVEPLLLPKSNSRPYDFISPKHKLAVVLEYLASGDLQRHIASCYRISKQHIGRIIDLVCNAICEKLQEEIKNLNPTLFLEIANGFNAHWNFPNCLGAIGGKHVMLKSPKNSGSLFYNYKGHHSIVLLAVCDAFYRFTYIDVGAYGSEGDANIFKESKFGANILNDRQSFPEDAMVNGTKLPFFYIGDNAFPLSKRLLKPYSNTKSFINEERIFNYRLSRARRCIENSFGILCSKWLCLKKILFCEPARAQKIIAACCFLHNHLLTKKSSTYCPINYADKVDFQGNILEGEWKNRISDFTDSLYHSSICSRSGRNSDIGKLVRDKIKEYVNGVGALPWQNKAAFVKM